MSSDILISENSLKEIATNIASESSVRTLGAKKKATRHNSQLGEKLFDEQQRVRTLASFAISYFYASVFVAPNQT